MGHLPRDTRKPHGTYVNLHIKLKTHTAFCDIYHNTVSFLFYVITPSFCTTNLETPYIENGVVYDVVHGIVKSVGLLYCQNVIRFYDAGLRVIPFSPTRKSAVFPVLIITRTIHSKSHFVQLPYTAITRVGKQKLKVWVKIDLRP